FERKSAREIAGALRLKEDAAQKRIGRALEKLRTIFTKSGVTGTTTKIAETISANSIQMAPAALIHTTTAVALTKGATASISTLTLIEGALKLMTWNQIRNTTVTIATIVLVVSTITVAADLTNTNSAATNAPPPEPMMLDVSAFLDESPPNIPPGILDAYLGKHFYDGLPFQIDGQGQLRGRRIGGVPEFDGVKVGRKFDELHMIHHARWAGIDGELIANIRLNYADGTKVELPIRYGQQVRDWYRTQGEEDETLTDPNSKIIFRRPPVQYGATIRIFKTKFLNPNPDKVVDTIDFVSTGGLSGYDVLAATVANKDPLRPYTSPVPEAERHFTGSIILRVLDAKTKKAITNALVNPNLRINRYSSVAPAFSTDENGYAVLRYPTNITSRIRLTIDAAGYTSEQAGWTNTYPNSFTVRMTPDDGN
ncbi:MAG TPA: hypothetical protein VN516_00890, partial [Candidatus Baltobacteraceae bacterium]|nr:hypothetical protein [Candidatus Baltobacteraceae bacterium]